MTVWLKELLRSLKMIKNKEKVFKFLDNLRDSGLTNMFGASPYVEAEFNVSKLEARELLSEWMKTFEERNKNNEMEGEKQNG